MIGHFKFSFRLDYITCLLLIRLIDHLHKWAVTGDKP